MILLYLHGLNGSLSPEKQVILERYGKVEAPVIDYENNPDSIYELYAYYKNHEFDVIMGSSMGGFAGYHLAKLFQLPALLFNPALVERSVPQNVPKTPDSSKSLMHIVLGSKDIVVNPIKTLHFFGDSLKQKQDYTISIRHDLEHRIPLNVFEEEVKRFMQDF